MDNKQPELQSVNETEDALAKAKKNKKALVVCSAIVGVLVVVALAWILISQTGSRKADAAVAKADAAALVNDSIASQLYAQAAEAGYKSGNRAKAEMGIRLYKQEKYAEALEYLNDCDLDDKVAEPGVYTLAGDCHVNLAQLDQALKCYDKAISAADNNPEIVPFILVKKANVYREQKNYAAEADALKEIIDNYPDYARSTPVKSLYERALAKQKA